MASPRARRSRSSSLMRSTVSFETSVCPATRLTWSATALAWAFAAARSLAAAIAASRSSG
eukprot:6038878-Prymnesium_polylepis.1